MKQLLSCLLLAFMAAPIMAAYKDRPTPEENVAKAKQMPCEYNVRYGHFIIGEETDLWITVFGDEEKLKTSTLYCVAFSIGGNVSKSIPIKAGLPFRMGHFMPTTTITFWFTTLNPLDTPPYNMAMTHNITVREGQGNILYHLENTRPEGAIDFILSTNNANPNQATLPEDLSTIPMTPTK